MQMHSHVPDVTKVEIVYAIVHINAENIQLDSLNDIVLIHHFQHLFDPITFDCGFCVTGLVSYIDFNISQFVGIIPYYIMNTFHLLHIVDLPVNAQAIIKLNRISIQFSI